MRKWQTQREAKLQNEAMDYSWNWFVVSAGQRMQTTNFFLVTVAVFATVYSTCIKEQMFVSSAAVAIIGLVVTFVFSKVEARTRQLVKAAEKALRPLEKRLARQSKVRALCITRRVEKPRDGAWSYHNAFRLLYWTSGIMFSLAGVYSAIMVIAHFGFRCFC